MDDEDWCPRGIRSSQLYTDPNTGIRGREYLVMWEGSSEVSWIAQDYFKGGPYEGRFEVLIKKFHASKPAPKPKPTPAPKKPTFTTNQGRDVPKKGPNKKATAAAAKAAQPQQFYPAFYLQPPGAPSHNNYNYYISHETVVDELYKNKEDAQEIFNKSLCQAARSGMADIVNLMLKDVSFINQNLWVDDLTLAMCANHLDRGILMKITWFCRNIRIFFLAAFYDSHCKILMDKDSLFWIITYFLALNKLKPGQKGGKVRERIVL